MRLIQFDNSGEITLTKDLIGDNIPPYAILSHTWGNDEDEVTFWDLMKGNGKKRPGYRKLVFCIQQARRDGLRYTWVDTCCIDRANNTELSEAINSMYSWYLRSVKCYVYLADVSANSGKDAESTYSALAFQASRWFTRGWTLQELIAPRTVEFFSREGTPLGCKKSLESDIVQATGIPVSVLRGASLSGFSTLEKFKWARNRTTKREEDGIYSLLGLFDVCLPLIYGEGADRASRRLRACIDESLKGSPMNNFSVPLNLLHAPEASFFVGRKVELSRVQAVLNANGRRHVAVVHGMGGIGKTQIAIELAKHCKDSYSAIFWANARDENTLRQSFLIIAKQIQQHHPTMQFSNENSVGALDNVVTAVKNWLSLPGNHHWLLIFDSYDNPVQARSQSPGLDICRYFPETNEGSIIITTRRSCVSIGTRILIRKLEDTDESLDILRQASQRNDIATDPSVMELIQKLDGLPLALITAGAYMHQSAVSCSDYCRLYEASWERLLRATPNIESYEDRNLYSTWQISIEYVKQQQPASAMLLHLSAYLSNECIWFGLFSHIGTDEPEWIQLLGQNELAFNQAVRVLVEHGLMEPPSQEYDEQSAGEYSIHKCVHSWVIEVLEKSVNKSLAILALKLIATQVPEPDDAAPWDVERRLMSHATHAFNNLSKWKLANTEIAWQIMRLGNLHYRQEKLDQAAALYKQAFEANFEALGLGHNSTLQALQNLGTIAARQGRLKDAESIYRNVVQQKEAYGCCDDIVMLHTIANLGITLLKLGQLEEAEHVLKSALYGKKALLGAQHPLALRVLRSLGELYEKSGDMALAEATYLRALSGTEKVLGKLHTYSLDIMQDLGYFYLAQGRFADAERMNLRTLFGRDQTVGRYHISTLDALNNVIIGYLDSKQNDRAELFLREELKVQEKLHGSRHEETINTLVALGDVCVDLDKLSEAEGWYQRALEGMKFTLGSYHESTLSVVDSTAKLYLKQGRFLDAEKMYLRILEETDKAEIDGYYSAPQNKEEYQSHCAERPRSGGQCEQGAKFADTSDSQSDNNLVCVSKSLRLHTQACLGDLLVQRGDLMSAIQMYSSALSGFQITLGEKSQVCQDVRRKLTLTQAKSSGNHKNRILLRGASGNAKPNRNFQLLNSFGRMFSKKRSDI